MAEPTIHAAGPPTSPRFPAIRALAQGWWLFLLRGAVGILFGLLVFLFPGPGLVAILAFLAAWMAVDGIASLVQAVRGGADHLGWHRSRTWLALDGVMSLLLAAAILFAPLLSAIVLVIMVGAWALVVGGFRIVLAWRAGDWLLGLLGGLTVLAGLWLVVAPGPGMLAVVWIIGLQAIVVGVLFVALGWRLRRVAQDPHGPGAAAA